MMPFRLVSIALALVLISSVSYAAEFCASAESRGLTSTLPLVVGADYNVQTPLGAWWFLGVQSFTDSFVQCADPSQEGTYWSDMSGITTVVVLGPSSSCDPPQVMAQFNLYQMQEPFTPCPDGSTTPPVVLATETSIQNLMSLILCASMVIVFALGYMSGVST